MRRLSNEEMGIETWDDADRHKKAFADASVCVQCGAELPSDGPVRLLPCRLLYVWGEYLFSETQVASACLKCWTDAEVTHNILPGECRGCGRKVIANKSRRKMEVFYCSNRCRNVVYGNRHRQRKRMRKVQKPLPLSACAVCGQNFAPKRKDAKTCSPACRQKAYRKRVTDKSQDDTMNS